jgi:hypothetical protein
MQKSCLQSFSSKQHLRFQSLKKFKAYQGAICPLNQLTIFDASLYVGKMVQRKVFGKLTRFLGP